MPGTSVDTTLQQFLIKLKVVEFAEKSVNRRAERKHVQSKRKTSDKLEQEDRVDNVTRSGRSLIQLLHAERWYLFSVRQ